MKKHSLLALAAYTAAPLFFSNRLKGEL